MKMNNLEKLAMNNPVRALIQRWSELPLLEQLGGRLDGLEVLEVGCGRGVGTRLLLEKLGARRVVAIDVDPDMIRRARRRLSTYPPDRLELAVASVAKLDAKAAAFDAVVDFAILHHVPDWQAAVEEVARVLKPGGRFFFEEVTAQWIHRWPYSVLFDHPRSNRFSGSQLVEALERSGIAVGHNFVERKAGDFIFGVGWRQTPHETARP